MVPKPFYTAGGYYVGTFGDDFARGRTPAYFTRSYWDSLSETSKPFVNIEELDSSSNAVISRKNYSYTPTSLALYGSRNYTTYVSPSSLLYPTTLSDYYPYYRLSSTLYNADPLSYSRALSYVPYRSYYSSLYYPRRHYPTTYDSSYYINRLLPYYYHPRPVYNNTQSHHYHYHVEPPRTTVTRTTRSYYVPPAITYYTPHYTSSALALTYY